MIIRGTRYTINETIINEFEEKSSPPSKSLNYKNQRYIILSVNNNNNNKVLVYPHGWCIINTTALESRLRKPNFTVVEVNISNTHSIE